MICPYCREHIDQADVTYAGQCDGKLDGCTLTLYAGHRILKVEDIYCPECSENITYAGHRIWKVEDIYCPECSENITAVVNHEENPS
jgi:hypothetical protein